QRQTAHELSPLRQQLGTFIRTCLGTFTCTPTTTVNLELGNVQECPECTQHTLLVEAAATAAAPEGSRSVCFCCGTDFEVIPQCDECCNAFVLDPADDFGLCGDCFNGAVDRF
ncbi:hypothetical protein ACFVFI_33125, partial [Streptomyces sp. NPDC057705]